MAMLIAEGTEVQVVETGEVGRVEELTRWAGKEEILVYVDGETVGFTRAELIVL